MIKSKKGNYVTKILLKWGKNSFFRVHRCLDTYFNLIHSL
jgi:hypothetical protein